MKKTKILLLAFIAIFTLAGCGSSNDDFVPTDGGGTSSGGNTGGGSTGGSGSTPSGPAGNTNMNMVTDGMPTVVANAIGGLEFPKLKNNGTSYTIVHMDGNDITYSTEWDDAKKAQRWSCYTFNTKNSKSVVGRPEDDYPSDTDLKSQYGVVDFTSDPYTRNGRYDHGHQCPSADRRLNSKQERQTDFLTNMQPQYSDFNQKGTWYNMENDLRRFVPKYDTDTLYVVKGGTIDSPDNIIEYIKNHGTVYSPKEGYIPVPRYFFVAVLSKMYNNKDKKYEYSAFGYWFPHVSTAMASGDKLSNYLVNIKTLEEKTGIDFFCNLPDETENRIENVSIDNIKLNWGFK